MPCFRCNPACQLCRPKKTFKAIRLCPGCGWYNLAENKNCTKCGMILPPMAENEAANQLPPAIPLAQCSLCSPLDNPTCAKCIRIKRVQCSQCGSLNIAGKKQCRRCGAGLPEFE